MVIAVLTVALRAGAWALGFARAMGFTTLSEATAISGKNVVHRCGVAVGLFGARSYFGVKIATLLPEQVLARLTGSVMLVSAGLMWLKMTVFGKRGGLSALEHSAAGSGWQPILAPSAMVGLFSGVMSGACGVGAAPFIQLGLLHFFRLSLPQVAGTTMLVTLPIAFMGGLGYLIEGHLDMTLFFQVVAGLMWVHMSGPSLPRRLHPMVLKTAMIAMPIIGGLVLVSPQITYWPSFSRTLLILSSMPCALSVRVPILMTVKIRGAPMPCNSSWHRFIAEKTASHSPSIFVPFAWRAIFKPAADSIFSHAAT